MSMRKYFVLLISLSFAQFLASPPARAADPVRVGVYQNAPLTFIEENGHIKGFFIDILEHIADKKGWKIEYEPCSWSECLSDLENGYIDLLGVIAYSESRDRIFDYTYESVITNWGQMYLNKKSDIESIIDLEGKKIAVLQNDIYFDNLRELVDQFGIQCRFIEVFEFEDVLELVESGRCEAGLVSQIYGLQREGDYDIIKSSILFSPKRLYWAAPQGKNQELLHSLDGYLKKLKNNQHSIYHEAVAKWFGIGVKSSFGPWIKWMPIIFLLLVALFFTVSLILRIQVKSKTKELLIKNEELIREIQFRKQAEGALQESGATLRSIFRAAPTGIGFVDDRVIRQANERLCEMLGYSEEELVGKNARLVYPTDEEFEYVGREKYKQIREKGTGTVETRWQRKDGKVFDVLLSSTPMDPDDLYRGVTFAALDITARKKAEAALRESEEECRGLYEESKRSAEVYRSLLHSSADAIVMYDFEGKVDYISPMFTKIFGWTLEEIRGERVPFLPDSEKEATMAIIENLVEHGTPCHGFETKRFTKEGNLLDVSISASRYDDHEGKPAGTLAILRDISEKRKLEAQLQQAHKMEAIGTLAGGVAHDFNNLMMGMLGNISLILHETDPEHPHHEKLKNVEELIQSSSKLTNQLLGFARKGKYEVKPTNLNKIVQESSETYGRARKEITIHRKLAKNLFALELDETQIQQVLLNLFINAADAMPGGGDLFLKTMNVTHKEMQGRPYETKPGNYVMLEITDQGTGMDKKTMKRIFDPFFTTKEMGRGTGLGLASAYGIIKGHAGYIDVDSKKGHGTTFNIYLPASEKEIDETLEVPERLEEGTGTILLVDDEEMVLEVGVEMLKKLGYDVLEAKNGGEAIEIFKERKDKIDMVILDMIMPGIGGGEAYDKIKDIDPRAVVLLSSGYSVDGRAQEILDRGCNGFIQKPFNLKDLSQKIKEVKNKK